MGSYLKINPIRLGKFNNVKYTNFMNRMLNQAVTMGFEKIGASKALIDNITTNVNTKRTSWHKAVPMWKPHNLPKWTRKTDKLIVYLMATFRTNRTSPIQAMCTAAETLYLKTKPYVGC